MSVVSNGKTVANLRDFKKVGAGGRGDPVQLQFGFHSGCRIVHAERHRERSYWRDPDEVSELLCELNRLRCRYSSGISKKSNSLPVAASAIPLK